MRLSSYALACAAFLAPAAGSADVTAPAPATRSVQLSKVLFDPNASAAVQHVKVGTICLLAGRPLSFGTGERTLNYERFEGLFSEALKRHHFNVVAKSSDLFESEDAKQADFLIGATVHPQSVDICDSVNGWKGTISFSVEWQIYDKAKHQVVDTATTQGSGTVPKFQRDGLVVMENGAFSASLAALIDQGFVQKYLGTPPSS